MKLIFIILFPAVFGWKSGWFEWDYYHAESLGDLTYESIPKIAAKDDLECSWICLKFNGCKGFSTHIDKTFCVTLNKTENLVKVSPKSKNAIKVYKDENQDVSYLHFIILKDNYEILDFSENPEKSPPITSYLKSTEAHKLRNGHPYIFENGTLQIYETYYTKALFEWNMDSENMISIPDTAISDYPYEWINPIAYKYSTSAFQNGKIFWIGGWYQRYAVRLYENGKWTRLKDFNKALSHTCACFVPGIDDYAYFFGNDNNLYEFDLIGNDFSVLSTIPNLNVIIELACAGGVKGNGQKIIVVSGGVVDGLATDNVRTYNFATNQWTFLASLPNNVVRATSLFVNPFFYVFAFNKAFKILPESGEIWTEMDIKGGSDYPLVLPYNY